MPMKRWLRKGVTGFYAAGEQAPRSKERTILKKLYWLAANQRGLWIKEVRHEDPMNHMRVTLSCQGTQVVLHINVFHEFLYMGGASEVRLRASGFPFEMLDILFSRVPEAQALMPIRYVRIGKGETIAGEHGLGEVELREILYHRPGQLREILFNEWA